MFKSMFDKLRNGLKKTKNNLIPTFSGKPVNDEFFDELEIALLKADVGVKATEEILDFLKDEAKRKRIKDAEKLKSYLKEKLARYLQRCAGKLELGNEKPAVILFLGINGSGKTTTIGKLAAQFTKEGKSVVLAAADTFRAAAIDQLEVWAERSGARIVKHSQGADPAAVVYDAVNSAKSRGDDIVLVDTAGRLHTKEHLMKELQKIKKTIQKIMPNQPVETILVLDGTIGQNSINQAKTFKEATDVTGIVITKLDGTAKGGALIPICQELKIPIKYIGVGEGIEDLQPFDPEAFVEALIED